MNHCLRTADAEKKRVLDKTLVVENETNQCKLREIEPVARMFVFEIGWHDDVDC